MEADRTKWDAIVIGSGIGGLACAAALTRVGQRVLLLEKHSVPGGLTQTFSRNGFTWDVGVHYLGDMGPQGAVRAVLDWLSDKSIEFASIGAIYETIHFPDDFAIQFSRPEAALKLDLKEKFPQADDELHEFFVALADAERAGRALFAQHATPPLLAKLYEFWYHKDIEKWWGRTALEVMQEMISDPRLRAVLLAQRGNYGGAPRESSFGMHATVMRHYFNGASYPVGGARAFADKLVPVIESRGAVRLNAEVAQLIVDNGAIQGVQLADGEQIHSARVFSDIGAHNTVSRLLPTDLREAEWAQWILSLRPSACHIGLYLGLEGDIQANGATPSNHLFYESWEIDQGSWKDPFADSVPPALFVSFPSLKNPQHDPGPAQRHTAELVAMTSWEAFSQWQDSVYGNRPESYAAFKETIERNL
ncbi:MAG TPA: NAD(P)/FAD-dependent oxidoreductase, partial [Burkholderiaceae bacterium]|nr:NAD(P)/FAD-dependent oxidoreductase [Burkholderiaceae bacterium]